MNVRSMKRALLLPILVLAFGVFASFVAWIVVDQQIHEGEQLRFERYSDRILTTIKQRLLDHERLLEGGKGLFYASESGSHPTNGAPMCLRKNLISIQAY